MERGLGKKKKNIPCTWPLLRYWYVHTILIIAKGLLVCGEIVSLASWISEI